MYLLLISLFVLSLLVRKGKLFFFIILFVIFVLHDGLRWNMGTDFEPYFDHFKDMAYYGVFNSNMEPLYNSFVYLVSSISGNYSFFLILHAVFIYSLYFFSVRKYCDEWIIAILILYVSTIGFLGMNRQHMALAICFFSIRYIIEGNKIHFVLLCLLASGFHTSALFFMSVYFLNRNISFKVILTTLIVIFFVSQTSLVVQLTEFLTPLIGGVAEDKLNYYMSSRLDFSNPFINVVLGSFKKGLVLFFIWSFRVKDKVSTPYFNLILNIYLISLVMYLLFNNQLQFLVGRFTIYFSIFECILYAWVYESIRNIKIRFLFFVFLVIFSLVTFFRSIAIYPELFLPYKSVFDL